MVVYNESSISIQLQWSGFTTYCPAWTAMLYCVGSPNALIEWSQLYILPVAGGGSPLSVVVVETFNDNEPILGTYPAPLVRQASISNNLNIGTSVSSLQNDNNASNTQIVEATVAGQGSSSVDMRNQGLLTLGNGSLPGQLALISQAPNSGAYSDVIDLGNGAQIGVFGSAGVDMQLDTSATGNLVSKAGGVQQWHSNAGGFTLDNGSLFLLAGSLSRLKYTHIASVTTTAAFVNHGLGAVPDFCILIANDGTLSSGLFQAYYESSSMTSTQVKLQSNSVGGIPVGLIAVKL